MSDTRGNTVVALLLVAMGASACSGSSQAAHGTPSRSTTTRAPALQAHPPACTRLSPATLGSLVGRHVKLAPNESVTTKPRAGQTDIRCVFDEPATGAEVGSVALSAFSGAGSARAGFSAARQAAVSFGLPVTSEPYGDAAYGVNQGASWSCVILSGTGLASAVLAGNDPGAACKWAELGLRLRAG